MNGPPATVISIGSMGFGQIIALLLLFLPVLAILEVYEGIWMRSLALLQTSSLFVLRNVYMARETATAISGNITVSQERHLIKNCHRRQSYHRNRAVTIYSDPVKQ